jgi:hypothetical protein
MEIEEKKFGKTIGKIVPESVFFRLEDNEISFEVETVNGREWFKSNEKIVVSKVFSLFNISRKELLQQVKDLKTTETDLLTFVRQTIKDKNRDLVILTNEKEDLVNVVTKRHKQISIKNIYDRVVNVANDAGFVVKNVAETDSSYQIVLKNGTKNDVAQSQVNVHLGRNDSRGRAGIHIQGSSNVFVCSNQIIADAGRDVMKHSKDLGLKIPKPGKLIHTTNIGERFTERIKNEIDNAKKASILVAEKLAESRFVPFSREEQVKTIDLIQKRHNIGKKYVKLLKYQLFKEDQKEPQYKETLYQLSQVLTYIGSHYDAGGVEIRKLLCKLGGQVVILGKAFTEVIKESIQQKEKPIVQTQ